MFYLSLIFAFVLSGCWCFQAEADPNYLAKLVQKADLLKLDKTVQWHKLLHYERTLFVYREGQARSEFYLAPNGKSSPQAELKATLQAFFSTDPVPQGQQHPQCRFRGRFLFLREKLDIDLKQLPEADCSRFEKFSRNIGAQSVTVVFSSYYLNNPSSAFGHSFIRLNKSDHSMNGKRYELLDYGINYAAVVDSENAVAYAVKGLTGMFVGTFTSIPYYYKVREYSEFENRDLWEYDLNFTQKQIDLLVAHIWELGSSQFDYYYLAQNCSYHVLSILDAANPDLKLLEKQAKIVIPSDTIKVITDTPGLVRGVHYRPSLQTQFDHRVGLMSVSEVKVLKENLDSHDPSQLPSYLSQQERARILDAEADYLELHYPRELEARNSDESRWMQKVLVSRSQVPIVSEELKIQKPDRLTPHLSHGSARLGVEPGYNSAQGGFTELSYRFALHDLLDQTVGYPSYAQIEMVNLRTRLNFDPQWQNQWFNSLYLFRVFSLNPVRTFDKKPSWRVSLGVQRFFDGTCEYCVGPSFELCGGWAVQPIQAIPVTAFLLAETETSASPTFNGSHFRLGLGPLAGLRLNLMDRFMGLLQAGYRYEFGMTDPNVYRLEGGFRLGLAKEIALDVRGTVFNRSQEVLFGVQFYH